MLVEQIFEILVLFHYLLNETVVQEIQRAGGHCPRLYVFQNIEVVQVAEDVGVPQLVGNGFLYFELNATGVDDEDPPVKVILNFHFHIGW